ncbi:MAG TPA: hypothetical protein VK824_12280 [Planctomycetota bacterium]|nr:hypothetical protein [Planctomycetota bacterium]
MNHPNDSLSRRVPSARRSSAALLGALCLALPAHLQARSAALSEPLVLPAPSQAPAVIGPGPVVVHSAFGGFILGYDIDQDGNTGLLCEAFTLENGQHDVAIETFDQRTGAIVKIVAQQLDSKSDFLALGVVGSHVGLVEFEHVSGLFVDKRQYFMLDPLAGGALTGRWTPPLATSDLILGVGRSQGFAETPVLAFHGAQFGTFLFGSDVKADTFGPIIELTDPDFDVNHVPVIALDAATHRAVLGTLGGNPFGPPKLATVDLSTGATEVFTGLGIGYVNGIAVDSSTGRACTSTEIDFRLEFYDLATHAGTIVKLPGAQSQAHSAKDVQCDPVHGLFLAGQPITSTGPAGTGSIQVFDEHGNFVESLNGFHLPASPALMALRPSRRTGFVVVAPDLSSLQSFTY